MSNVLPPEAKRHLWSEYRARFILVGSLLAILTALLGILALLPTYLTLHSEVTMQEGSGLDDASRAQDRLTMGETQSLIALLAPSVTATTTPANVIARILELRPKGVLVDHITYSGGTFLLAGSSGVRDGVGLYRTALDAEPIFTTVSVPVGDLVGASGRFSMTITGQF